MGKFVIAKSPTGFVFHLVAQNGETIAVGGEVYSSYAAAKKGAESVQHNAPVAHLEDQTSEGFETQKNPKFEVYKDKAGEFRFRLNARNGEHIAASEGYTTKSACLKGIESVQRNALDAKFVDQLD